ncbi:MAG: ATP-binding cassette domain-containing protein [Turicibacter sp.]|nr:ATP-binding cassette domain-containing protein [Turicibacter sp.]
MLENVSFSVSEGEFVCIVGSNGAGKSTLLKILMNLLKPTAGEVHISTSNIAYMSQKTSFNPDFPANTAEIVGLGIPSGKRISLKERHTRVQSALLQMDMQNFSKKPIGKLSGGQQQRILLAKALVQEPDLIILDEPTSSIDYTTTNQIYHMLERFNKEQKITVVTVTHDTNLISSHRVACSL